MWEQKRQASVRHAPGLALAEGSRTAISNGFRIGFPAPSTDAKRFAGLNPCIGEAVAPTGQGDAKPLPGVAGRAGARLELIFRR